MISCISLLISHFSTIKSTSIITYLNNNYPTFFHKMQCTHVRSLSNLCQITGSPCFDTHKRPGAIFWLRTFVTFFFPYTLYMYVFLFPLFIQFFHFHILWKDQVHDNCYYKHNCYYVCREYRLNNWWEFSPDTTSLVVVNPIPMDNAIATIVIFSG